MGDAGTATLLELDDAAAPLHFRLATDGRGAMHLAVRAGGFRQPRTPESGVRTRREGKNVRSDEDLCMNGSEIVAFTIREVPSMVQGILNQAGWAVEDTDAFVFHQANRYIQEYLAKRLKLPAEKVPCSIQEYGNTSSASVPLALVDYLRRPGSAGARRFVLAGFGVGLSWAAAACDLAGICVPPLVSVSENEIET
jgi:3-oxoacyl-[acyl-carrier-protein] synthase-3